MLDIDDFKAVNDAHGHAVGDRVLLCAAQWLTKGLRHTDFIARYGGEEFAIILTGISLQEAEKRLTQILADIAERTFAYDAHRESRSVRFTLSCGVTSQVDSDTGEDLLQRADAALYDAKRRGKNRVVARAHGRLAGLFRRQ